MNIFGKEITAIKKQFYLQSVNSTEQQRNK